MDQQRSFAAVTLVAFTVLANPFDLASARAQALPAGAVAGSAAPPAQMSSNASQAASGATPSDESDAAAGAHGRVLEFRFTPVHNAQIAMWLENGNGEFLQTVGLTEATARRGIGNRPGASQMNSGFRWPYGRREGVLPIWAHRRVSAEGAQPFRRVIFQNRKAEGLASRTSDDFSKDDYFCLSFNNSKSKKDALDAVSCASVFSSDKGRYMTDADVANGYSEPYEDIATHEGRMQPLTAESLYPPRRDAKACTGGMTSCFDHADSANFNQDSLAVMPELDAVSMATPQGGQEERRLFAVPNQWADGSYRACIEINVEGDHNATFDETHFPTPTTPQMSWDSWALSFGYPYRGQPSVVYCTPVELQSAGSEMTFSTAEPIGSTGSWDTAAPTYATQLADMHGMTDDHAAAPGSGADRLFMDEAGSRFTVVSKPSMSCMSNVPPTDVGNVHVTRFPKPLHAHEYAELEFSAAADDVSVFRYEVRVSTEPMADAASFMRATPAKSATVAADALMVPVEASPGQSVKVSIGGLTQETHYFVGVRAVDGCAMAGPVSVGEITTPMREFATVTPCFVATAAYGTPLAAEIVALRRFRDRHLVNNALGRSFVDAYYSVGPKLANVIREDDDLRAASRALLTPLVALVRMLDD
ncbi:MAG TPA: CFI-box-CTERM domain-containing protein [Polyangiales bacterium]|nr:CFI-box-CTERM domain-containing protein [Polyangiales bacterium]